MKLPDIPRTIMAARGVANCADPSGSGSATANRPSKCGMREDRNGR